MINRWFVIVVALAALIGGIVAGVWAAAQPERYEAQAVLAVGPSPDLETDADVIDVVAGLDRGGLVATAAGIAASEAVREAAIEGEELDIADVGDYEIDSVPVLDSNLVDVIVTGPDPDDAATLANAVSAQLQTRFGEIYGVYRIELLTPAEPPGESDRPSVLLVVLAGAIFAAAVTAAVWWAAVAGRRPTTADADES